MILASLCQLRLFVLGQEVVSAVPEWDGGDWFVGLKVLRRWSCQKVTSGSFFESWVVCEEILQQPWRRLACTVNTLALLVE